jgi:hypothetical protein
MRALAISTLVSERRRQQLCRITSVGVGLTVYIVIGRASARIIERRMHFAVQARIMILTALTLIPEGHRELLPATHPSIMRIS